MNSDETSTELQGNEALDFAERNLMRMYEDVENWRSLWRQPLTGDLWVESYPFADSHGGGPPVFRRISNDEAVAMFGDEVCRRPP